jgi:medium-chain acyl-[acyl-carrier-protein] hydrolase
VKHPAQTRPHNVWLPAGSPSREAAINLFCFHHAGGSAAVFRDWQSLLSPQIHVCPVELAGHGTRMHEQPRSHMTQIIDDLERGLASWLGTPFAFFGHSMGGAIACELSYRLRSRFGTQPEYLIVAGSRAPSRPISRRIHDLPQPMFIEELRRLNGTPEELLSNPEVLDMLLPMLRADFAVVETRPRMARERLDCPILAMGGMADDRIALDDVLAWGEVTSAAFTMQMLPGDHFFVNSSREQLLHSLSTHLLIEAAQTSDAYWGHAMCSRELRTRKLQ